MPKNLGNYLLYKQMKTISKISLSCLSAFLLFSCNEYSNDISPVAIFVTPNKSEVITISAGDKAKYDMTIYADKGNVSRFQISSFDAYKGDVLYKDTTINDKEFSYTFVYNAPLIDRDSLDVLLKLYAWNSGGAKCETERNIIVKSKTILLEEKNGIILWQQSLNRPDALSFANPSKTFYWESSPDSIYADIYVEGDESFREIQLKSMTKTKFVRNNSFDYASATAIGVSNVYNSSLRTDYVTDLRLNDVILIGHDNNAEGVFHVTNIVRNNTTDGCCIQLSFKAIN